MEFKNDDLFEKNNEIRRQKSIIEGKAELLKTQADELGALNILKNKLFSVIAHDLKTPMYALRTLFRNVEQQHLSGNEIKSLVPHVVNDLNYTISLMENLLQWSKTQMEGFHVQKQAVDISMLINAVVQLLRLQAEAKSICVEISGNSGVQVLADKDMINLVLRNLLSNAIKFTPACGRIVVDVEQNAAAVKVSVRDNGTGISAEALKKIKVRNYYTTNGTANESGTGLGLMLCDEFLRKNNGSLLIRSEPDKGSDISFSLPAAFNG
jgi:signal transduction histidine kinase